MLSKLIKLPIFKRIIPSLAIRIVKILKKNKGYFKINGTVMYLDFLDPIDREIILYKKYEDEEVQYLIILIRKYLIKKFFDVGSNCGYYSIKILTEIPELDVTAFEPNKEAYLKFQKTIKKNSNFLKKIKLKNFGLSNKNSILKMKFLNKHGYNQTGGSSVIEDFNYIEKNTFVSNFKTGDSILKLENQILCFKIDVERHEFNVLQGLKNLFKKNKIILLIEIYEKNFIKCNNFLKKLGFKLIKKFSNRSNFVYKNF